MPPVNSTGPNENAGSSSSTSTSSSSLLHPLPAHVPRPESLDYIWRARLDWERRLRYELRAVGKKQERNLIQLRETLKHTNTTGGEKNGTSIGDGILPTPSNDFQVRFVYTAEDLLEILVGIKNPNQLPFNGIPSSSPSVPPSVKSPSSSPPPSISPGGHWHMIQLELPTMTLAQLATKYGALHPSHRQVGVDDTVLGLEWFGSERLKQGEDLLKDPNVTIQTLRHFARTGLHPSLRPQFWSRLCGVQLPLSSARSSEYDHLLLQVRTWSLLTDDLLQFDVEDGPGDDEAYFVFHEPLQEMMLAFSRDTKMRVKSSILLNAAPLIAQPSQALKTQLERMSHSTSTPVTTPTPNPSSNRNANGGTTPAPSSSTDPTSRLLDAVPPNRLIPFHRLAYFATPLCFVYSKTPEAYFVFRELYARYFCRLSIVSSAPSGILSLSRTFEVLLLTRAPHLVYRCLELGVQPLTCAFGWMFTAFSGFLEVDQLLLLWDRLIAFDNLELLAVLSASIFLWREQSIMRSNTRAELHDCMRELVNLKVIPLLQHFLFAS